MREIQLLVCDQDKAYLEALVCFLIGSKKGISVHSYYEKEAFMEDQSHYDLALLTREFLDMEEESTIKKRAGVVFFLCKTAEPDYPGYEKLYKFQDMDQFLEKICRVLRGPDVQNSMPQNANCHIYSIYSPMNHELLLPFTLFMCRMMEEQGDVLLVDMEENSILEELIQKESSTYLMDYLYELEANTINVNVIAEEKQKRRRVHDFTDYYEGFDFLPPVKNPLEISLVTQEQWKRMGEDLEQESYRVVVYLFDRIHQGFGTLVQKSEELILLGKAGDYYQKSMEKFRTYLKENQIETPQRRIDLPMSAGNLVDGRIISGKSWHICKKTV